MASNRSGWFREPYRHYLAAKGIRTRYFATAGDKIASGFTGLIQGYQQAGKEEQKRLLSPDVLQQQLLKTAVLQEAGTRRIPAQVIERKIEGTPGIELNAGNLYTKWTPQWTLNQLNKLENLGTPGNPKKRIKADPGLAVLNKEHDELLAAKGATERAREQLARNTSLPHYKQLLFSVDDKLQKLDKKLLINNGAIAKKQQQIDKRKLLLQQASTPEDVELLAGKDPEFLTIANEDTWREDVGARNAILKRKGL